MRMNHHSSRVWSTFESIVDYSLPNVFIIVVIIPVNRLGPLHSLFLLSAIDLILGEISLHTKDLLSFNHLPRNWDAKIGFIIHFFC